MIWRTACCLLLACLDPCTSWMVDSLLRRHHPWSSLASSTTRIIPGPSSSSSSSSGDNRVGYRPSSSSSSVLLLLHQADTSSDNSVAIVEEEWDEDAVANIDTTRRFDDFRAELVRLSDIASTDETAVDQAITLLDEMFQTYVVTEDARLYPNIDIYNHILTILAQAKSRPDDETTTTKTNSLAQTIYAKLQDPKDTATPMANTATYVAMMDYWIKRKDTQQAVAVFESAMASSAAAVMDISLWNKLIHAHGRAGQPDEAFNVWLDLQSKESMIQPNERTFVELLRSQYSKLQRLNELWNSIPIPEEERTVDMYNAYLFGQTNPRRSEALMYGMIQKGIAPNVKTIHQVIQAYAITIGLPALKIEQYLTLLPKNVVIPDRTLAIALQALSNHATCSRKPQKAQSLLERFHKPPSVDALRSAIRSCATIPVDSYPEDKLEAFRIGYNIYENLDGTTKARLHGNVLQLAANLLPPESEKLSILAKRIFAQAQEDGTANNFCIKQFRRAASSAVQLQVFGGDYDDLLQLPPSWSRNDKTTTTYV